MRLLVSCIPFDGGKSGISEYTRQVVRELAAQGHALTLLVEPGAQGREGLAPSRPSVSDSEQPPCGVAAPASNLEHPPCGAAAPASDSAQPPCGVAAPASDSEQPPCGVAAPASNLEQPPCGVAIPAPRWTRRPVLSMVWHLFALPFWILRHRREFDGFFICAANRRVCAFHPLPTAATVHDLANFHIPGKYSRSRMFYLARILPFFAKRAQHLVAVSESTKADMVRFWHCRPGDVTVLLEGLPPAIPAPAAPGGARPQPANGGAILYISRIEHPGKNHVRLIEAYGRLPRETAGAHPLVLAGADWKDAEAVHEAAARSPNAAFIRFTGFVPAEQMEALWAQAGFYVFPSLFEGFGLSLAEAMARGVPCTCSENGSLGEIGGGAALKFDPESVGSIAAALETLLSESPEARASRVSRGLARVRDFSWAGHAAGIVRLLS